MFYRDERELRNFIEDFRALAGLIDDPDALEQATVPREGWLKHILPTTDVWLLFPAKLYCGQSLLDGRRESVIIDYAYNDELARLPGAPRRARRPQRPAHPRRDPDDPARASTWAAPTPTRSSC